jgi:hypothetical protein
MEKVGIDIIQIFTVLLSIYFDKERHYNVDTTISVIPVKWGIGVCISYFGEIVWGCY